MYLLCHQLKSTNDSLTSHPSSRLLVFCQLKNSLRDNLCLDQGPDGDNIPIMYLCHGMTPQVSCFLILFCCIVLLIQDFLGDVSY